MSANGNPRLYLNRRTFLGGAGLGLGTAALASLLDADLPRGMAAEPATSMDTAALVSHVAPKAKRVIFLYMSGGPSHLETFDHKPLLAELDGQPMPDSFTRGQPIAQLQGQELNCLRPLFKFARHGQSGQEIADILPHIATIA